MEKYEDERDRKEQGRKMRKIKLAISFKLILSH